jgi:hypothetical protein
MCFFFKNDDMDTKGVVYSCNPNYIRGQDREDQVWTQPGAKARPYLKNKLKAKRGKDVFQVLEHLPSKLSILSSILNTAKKKTKKTKPERKKGKKWHALFFLKWIL